MLFRSVTFLVVTVLVTLALIALLIVGFMAPVLERLAPPPTQPGAVTLLLVLACVVFLVVGVGLPFAMRIGAWAGDAFGGGSPGSAKPGDGALAARMRAQHRRLTLIAGGLFCPACLALLLFNVPRDGVIVAVQVLAFAAMGCTIFLMLRNKRAY